MSAMRHAYVRILMSAVHKWLWWIWRIVDILFWRVMMETNEVESRE
jgi:hypothetical protein